MSEIAKENWPALFPEDYIPQIIQDVLDSSQNLKRPDRKEKRPEEALSKQVYRKLIMLPP